MIDKSFLFTCRLLLIISTPTLVVSGNFSSIRIVLSCFYLLIFYFDKIILNLNLPFAVYVKNSLFICFEQQSPLTPALHSKAPQSINLPSLLQETCGSLQWEVEQAVCDILNLLTYQHASFCYLSFTAFLVFKRSWSNIKTAYNIHVSANFFWLKDMRFFPAKASVFTEEPTIPKSA